MNFSAETDLLFSLEKRMYISSILDEKLIYALSTIIHRLNLAVEDEVQDSVDREEKSMVIYFDFDFLPNQYLRVSFIPY